jgi:hypothetical protein
MVECMPNNHESLSSNPSNAKQSKTKWYLSGILIECIRISSSKSPTTLHISLFPV